MKIVYLNYMWDLWGISIGSTIKAMEILRAIESCGHQIKKYWLGDDFERKTGGPRESTNEFRQVMKKYFKRYLHEPSQLFKNLPQMNQELAILEEEKPDLVISRIDSYNFSNAKVAQRTNLPFLIEADCPASYEKIEFQKYFRSTRWLLYYLERKQILTGRAAFTVSNQMKDYFVSHGVPADFMQVIPNGADPERFRPDAETKAVRQKYGLEVNTIVGFVGSFIYWHGIENLTFIMEKTLASDRNTKFLMVGDGGPMKPMLEKFIAERHLEDRAILTGFVPHEEIPKYIAAMDVVLAPYPGLDFFYYSPVKIYEYMCSGKPVVSTRIGQIAEVIQHGQNGFLTEPDDVEKIKEIVVELIHNPELRQEIGLAAREEILKNHTWKQRGTQLSELCYRCIH